MSTAIVSAEHINVILEAATRDADEEGFEWFAQGKWWTFTRSNRDRIGQLMLDANLDAYGRRYLEPTEVYVYSYSIPIRIHEPIEVLKAIDGYEYQCSVDASWDTHPIHLMMQQLRKRVIAWLDGYDAAEWLIQPRPPPPHTGWGTPPGTLSTPGGGVLPRGRTPVRSGGRKCARSQLSSAHMQLIKQGGQE